MNALTLLFKNVVETSRKRTIEHVTVTLKSIFCILGFFATFPSIGHAAVLVTGGTGYIGSHVAIELLNEGYEVIIVDNLANSKQTVVQRIEKITGKKPKLYIADLEDKDKVDTIFKENKIEAVIHLAGLKAVGESVQDPRKYYKKNIGMTLQLLDSMEKAGCYNLIFSSSATVYGEPEQLPFTEDHRLKATNPYGRTKLIIEGILEDHKISNPKWNFIALRYFNPVGAHESGDLGEDPNGIPNNLMPFLLKIVAGKIDSIKIYGNDYDTVDGTAVRDYIHVIDLAKGHLAALKKLEKDHVGFKAYNLGSGRGHSVLQVVNAVSKAWGKPILYEYAKRRNGDIGVSLASASLARGELGWDVEYGLEKMAADGVRWILQNPDGYPDSQEDESCSSESLE